MMQTLWKHFIGNDMIQILLLYIKTKPISMVWVRERTIPTERPPLVGEVIANLCG
jgi:hypothetical protein